MSSNRKIDIKYLLDQMLSGKLTVVEKNDLQNYILTTYKDRELNTLMRDHWVGLENKEMVADEMQLLILKNKIFSSIAQTKSPSKSKYRLFSSNWSGI
jgi:transmembrane sensor